MTTKTILCAFCALFVRFLCASGIGEIVAVDSETIC